MFKYDVGDGMHLRLLERHHAGELFELTAANREHLSRWLPWVVGVTKPEHSLSFIERSLSQFARGEGCQIGIWHQERLAGVIGYHRWDFGNRGTSLGYWLGKEHEGRGLVTKACRVLIDHAFSELDFIRVEIRCATDNLRSRAVPERLGFTPEGVVRRGELIGGRALDHVLYGLLRDEWVEGEGQSPVKPGQDPRRR